MRPLNTFCLPLASAILFGCADKPSAPPEALSQGGERLCQLAMNPEVSKLTLHWDSFNMFGNRKETFSESGYTQSGEGPACKIKSQRSTGAPIERPCTWNPRLSCDLQLGKDPVSTSFSGGQSYQYGKLQWVGNETFTVNVKRGSATTAEARKVAVVKFNGSWSQGGGSGVSTSTIFYDRELGIMLKADGAHDANKWGDTVTLVEVRP